jgi:tRNA-specific 2-thiouridylase
VLGVLTTEQLAHAMFPLGETPSKDEVRAEAAARGLTVAQKPDSHDICFIPDGDTRGWLAGRVGAEQGAILDRTGERIGTHEGAAAFTVGQRKGLNIGFPSDDGKPRFVLEVRPKTNEVVVGPREALAIAELAGSRFSWAGMPPADPETPFDCEVQVRAHGDPVAAIAALHGGELHVTLTDPLTGVAPGQTAVIYLGTRVLGQFTIDRTVSALRQGSSVN